MSRTRTDYAVFDAAIVALVLGAFASAGLVAERISGGDASLALAIPLATLGLTLVASILLRPIARRAALLRMPPVSQLIAGQSAGVLLGVALTHAIVALTHPSAGLRETPAQLVNDATLGLGLVLLMWSVVARGRALRLGALVGAAALVGVYRATASLWHADAIVFPTLTIQQFVPLELVSVLLGLVLVDWLGAAREQR
ncbi:MAG: hypothetical protein U1F43_26970 [Myxococcota bacterium]